jgi:hypothetical protein
MSLCPEVLTSEQKFQRRIFVVRIACQQGVQAAALRSGIPDRTIRDWKAKLEKFGIEGLREKSRKPNFLEQAIEFFACLGVKVIQAQTAPNTLCLTSSACKSLMRVETLKRHCLLKRAKNTSLGIARSSLVRQSSMARLRDRIRPTRSAFIRDIASP